MNICFLIDDYSAVGGIQRVASIIASRLADKHQVYVVSMYQEHGDNGLDLYSENLIKRTLIKGRKHYIRQALPIAFALRRYLKENSIDVLVSSSEMLSPYCYLATVFTDTPFICWTHTPALNNSEAIVQSLFKWLALKKAACTVALTEDTVNELKKKYHTEKVTAIPNPIDPKLLKDVTYDENSRKIVTVGRICPQKYYDKLVEVAACFLKNYPEWTWDIYGSGNEEEKIRQLIKDNGLDGQITLKGDVKNMYDLYGNYALQVMTSRFEGFPMTLLEGMANGLPLVAFDVSGVNAIIKDGFNGCLAEPFDEKEMAEKIEQLIKSKAERQAISERNIKDRSRYEVDIIAGYWEDLFEKTIRNSNIGQK